MLKRERLLWALFAGILVFLYLLSSTDLIIKEKKTEVYTVSVIISDTSDEMYGSFKKGVEQAAAEYNVDVRFITLYEKGDSAQQMEFLRREIDDGTGAVILEPANPRECMALLDAFPPASPVIVTGSLLHSERAAACVGVDASLAGRRLGEAVCRDSTPGLPVLVFAENMDYGNVQELYDGLMSAMDGQNHDTRLYETLNGEHMEEALGALAEQGERAAVVALDPSSTREAARLLEEDPDCRKAVPWLYGTGATPALLNYLDQGTIRGLLTSNAFDNGYLCVEQAVGAIRRQTVETEIALDSYYIEKEALRDRQYEKMLYPMS